MNTLLIHILRLYKRWISPSLPPSCRYVPSCSDYAMEAIERYGAFRGGLMAVGRLLRCHPFVRGGYDPVVNTSSHRTEDARLHRGSERYQMAMTTSDQRLTTSERIG